MTSTRLERSASPARRTVLLRTILAVIVIAIGGACEDPRDHLEEVIAEARACEAGDTYVLAGGTDCTCAQPVRTDAADAVDAAAAGVQCCDLLGRCVAVDCAAFANVRCEAGQCVGD